MEGKVEGCVDVYFVLAGGFDDGAGGGVGGGASAREETEGV